MGKPHLKKIKKYKGFICEPSHTNYRKVINRRYNRYHPLSIKPKPGEIKATIEFFKHIFGDQFELGLDYLQLLFLKPKQHLPILCLVSNERSTGKSTFLKFLKLFFEENATYLTNDSFKSSFNSDWAEKLLIFIDEVLFNREEYTERLKYLSTTTKFKIEAKGKDRMEIDAFLKFILCSNNEDNFIKIDKDSIRFWVLKIPKLQKENPNILEELKSELPAFMHFLTTRELSTPQITRMWFSFDQIKTKAFQRLVQNNKDRVERELANILIMIMERMETDVVKLCSEDALNLLKSMGIKTDLGALRRILKAKWKLKNQPNSNSYEQIRIGSNSELRHSKAKGRYFTITKEFIIKNFDDFDEDDS